MCLLGYQTLRYSCPRKFEKSHYRCKSLSVLAACIENIFTRNNGDRLKYLKKKNLSLLYILKEFYSRKYEDTIYISTYITIELLQLYNILYNY